MGGGLATELLHQGPLTASSRSAQVSPGYAYMHTSRASTGSQPHHHHAVRSRAKLLRSIFLPLPLPAPLPPTREGGSIAGF